MAIRPDVNVDTDDKSPPRWNKEDHVLLRKEAFSVPSADGFLS